MNAYYLFVLQTLYYKHKYFIINSIQYNRKERYKVGMLDTLLRKETLSQRTLDIESDLYENLIRLSENEFDASVSKIINLCIYELAEKEQVTMREMKDLEKHSVIMRKSALETLNKMKKKYNIPIYVLINIAIKEGIEKLEQKIK